jgi:hypothetical protein
MLEDWILKIDKIIEDAGLYQYTLTGLDWNWIYWTLVTTSNFKAVANLHALILGAAYAKSSHFGISSLAVTW